MTLFWIIAAGLTLLAIAFVLFPLFFGKSQEQEDVDRNKLNIEVIRQQLAELDADLAAGTLEREQYDKAREDLERELLADVSDDDGAVTTTGSGKWAFIVSAILIPLIAFPLYSAIGGYDELTQAPVAAHQTAQGGAGKNLPPLDKMIGALEAKLRQDPNNVQGWQLLGRTYIALKRPTDARNAYKKAYELSPEDPDVLLAYADVLAALNDDSFSGEPARLVDKALKLSPEHPNGLWMAGVVEFQRGAFKKSVAHWEKLKTMLPPASENLADLDAAIKEARSRAGMPAPAELPSIMAAASGKGIQVTVDIDPALKGQYTPDDTVFIYAKAMSGPPMPLAVVRKKVSDLPVTVTLDDSMAMMPRLKLSGFPQVAIGARISKSGKPVASDGDLEGSVGPVPTQGGQAVSVTIDQVHGAARVPPAQAPVAEAASESTKAVAVAPVAPATPAPVAPAASARPGITVRVDIDPALKSRYSPNDLLFVYAKATSGPPMPLAVVRKRAADLPLTVRLDDSMAMMPQLRLSAFPKVTVGARISKSGRPMASPGDLEGVVSPVPTQGSDAVTITISQVR